MSDSTPYTDENYRTLAAAIATGAKSVRYGNKEVVYQDTESMKATLSEMAIALGYKKPGSGRTYGEYCSI